VSGDRAVDLKEEIYQTWLDDVGNDPKKMGVRCWRETAKDRDA
jgi:hypothetical protein